MVVEGEPEDEGDCAAAQRRETSVAPIGRPFMPEVVLSRVRRDYSASGTDCAGEGLRGCERDEWRPGPGIGWIAQ